MHVRVVLAIGLLCYPFLGSCGLQHEPCDADKTINPSPIVKEANEQENLWNSSKPEAYTMLVDRGCFCNSQWWVSSVNGDASSSFVFTNNTVEPSEEFATINDVFDHIRAMAEKKPASMDVSYSQDHFPESYGGNPSECVTDGSVGYDVEFVDFADKMGTARALSCSEAAEQLSGTWLLQNSDASSPVTASVENFTSGSVRFTEYSSFGIRTLSLSVLMNEHGDFCPIVFDKPPVPTDSKAFLLTSNTKEIRIQSLRGELAFYRRVTEPVAP